MVAGEVHEGAPPRLFHAVIIREARPDEWRQSRALRLEMLADTPHSFGDQLEDVLAWDDDRWMTRHESHLLPDSAVFVAVTDDGRWLAHMGVREFHNYSPPRAWLMGVYVTPTLRGTGTAALMLRAVESWTVDRGFDRLFLDVHERALPARRFYEKLGFVETGQTLPYPLDPTTSELEMMKTLTGPSIHRQSSLTGGTQGTKSLFPEQPRDEGANGVCGRWVAGPTRSCGAGTPHLFPEQPRDEGA